jgi:cystathionine beta-lyase
MGVIRLTYDFNAVIDRRNTGASKWDAVGKRFGSEDVIPLWVADMDFSSPQCVIDAIVKRAEHGVYGYAVQQDAYFEAIVKWFKTRHHWQIERDWIAPAPGVVPALSVIVQAFTEPQDGVLIQPPVYHPFKKVISVWDRKVIENPLVERNGRYEIDFADLEIKAAQAKVMFLCSPHNPVGRVWTPEELQRVGEICLRHGVLVISDEIHADLIFRGHRHTPFASLSPQFAEHSLTCAAPSKTFNLAGLTTAYVIAPNPALKKRYEAMLNKASMGELNIFGIEAMIAAYEGGAEWLDALLEYLEGNLEYLKGFVAEHLPQIRVIEPEGTYLVWLDCTKLNLSVKELDRFFVHKAGLALNEGHLFGREGEGFQRVNIACPRQLLVKGMEQLKAAVEELEGARR